MKQTDVRFSVISAEITITIENKSIPAQWSTKHSTLCSSNNPSDKSFFTQGKPPPEGGGSVHSRVRFVIPEPQGAEQFVHIVQFDQLPLTKKKRYRYIDRHHSTTFR